MTKHYNVLFVDGPLQNQWRVIDTSSGAYRVVTAAPIVWNSSEDEDELAPLLDTIEYRITEVPFALYGEGGTIRVACTSGNYPRHQGKAIARAILQRDVAQELGL